MIQTKKDKKEVWVLTNPGFYFPFVKYAETTIVTQTPSEMSGRAKQFYDLVKNICPRQPIMGLQLL